MDFEDEIQFKWGRIVTSCFENFFLFCDFGQLMDHVNALGFKGIGFSPYWMLILLVICSKPLVCVLESKGKIGKVMFETDFMN